MSPARVTSLAVVLSCAMMMLGVSALQREGDGAHAVAIKIQLKNARNSATLVERPDGTHSYVVTRHDGTEQHLTPEQFAAELYDEHAKRTWLQKFLNISGWLGLIWVAIGFVGQMLFAGRMLVQWIISEKQRQSVVPPVFWWMSLIGASMLLSYFLWRRDVIGVLGQGLGWVIYIRNLHLIHRSRRIVATTVDAAPAAELDRPSLSGPSDLPASDG
jgi:lipid-A-disaccharide synthase-like uncharacterized protein